MNIRSNRLFGLLALTSALVVAACDESPTDHDDHDHSEPEAVEIRLGSQVLARATPSSATGSLSVTAGDETAHLDVVFVDDHGDAVELDDDYYLDVQVGNMSVAEWEQHEAGEFGGHLVGLAAGTTTLTFRLMHGSPGSGHADFIAAQIQAIVN